MWDFLFLWFKKAFSPAINAVSNIIFIVDLTMPIVRRQLKDKFPWFESKKAVYGWWISIFIFGAIVIWGFLSTPYEMYHNVSERLRKLEDENTVKLSGEILSVIKSPFQANGDQYIFFDVRVHSDGAPISIVDYTAKAQLYDKEVDLQRIRIPDRGIRVFGMLYHPFHTIFERTRYGIAKRQSVDGVMLFLFKDAKKYEGQHVKWNVSFKDDSRKEYQITLADSYVEQKANIYLYTNKEFLSAPKGMLTGS